MISQLPEMVLPRVRSDLRFTPVHAEGNPYYVIEDRARNRYFRIGVEEYLFISRLNQTRNLDDLLAAIERSSSCELSKEQAGTILNWLAASQLLQQQDEEQLVKALGQQAAQREVERISKINLVLLKLPCFNPDPFLNWSFRYLRGFTGRLYQFCWLIILIWATGTLCYRWQPFVQQAAGFFSLANLVLIWGIWFALKAIHELSHALVCKRYGGHVYEAGLLLILFIPLTYVNATSSWAFDSRWKRMHVAVAGMQAELFAASIALLVWAAHPESSIGAIARNTAIIAGVSSILFNANPLMRFDGYYILSDLIAVPNLYTMGMRHVRNCFSQWFLGISGPAIVGDSPFVRMYGWGVWFWRLFILFSLVYLATFLAGGLGIFIAIGAVAVWLGLPLHIFRKKIPAYREKNPEMVRHFIKRLSITALCAIVVISCIGWKKRIHIPGVVEYEEQYVVRTGVPGFVDKIYVSEGDHVEQHAPLLLLVNENIVHRQKDLQNEYAQVEIEMRQAHCESELAQYQVLQERAKTLEENLTAIEEDIASLTVRSPGEGMVLAPGLDEISGIFIPKGTEIAWVVSPDQKQIVATALQEDIETFSQVEDLEMEIDMNAPGIPLFFGRLQEISPTMSTRLIHPALGAVNGGPLDVRQLAVAADSNELEQHYRLELFVPRFTLDVSLPENIRDRLYAGQLAELRIEGSRESLASYLIGVMKDWLKRKQAIAGG
jgi:putative peptide zinc metalloprotease protein